MVEDVEELSSETKPEFLDDVKFSLQCGIDLPGTETSHHISTEISLLTGRRGRESSSIEDFAPRKL
jgi:hypothetical protein